jgi:hypothetical protein
MLVVPIFTLSPAFSLTVEQFHRLIATEHLKTDLHLSILRMQSRSLNVGPMGDTLRYAKRVTTEKRYSVLWEESSEAFPPNDLD